MQLKAYNPEFEKVIKEKLQGQYFMKLIDFEIDTIEIGRIEGELKLEQKHKQQKGFAHGGLIATLADITAGFAASTLVPKGHNVVTGELKVSYLNPGVGERLRAIGYVIKQGKKINFCEAEVWSQEEEDKILIAKASASMITIFPGDFKE